MYDLLTRNDSQHFGDAWRDLVQARACPPWRLLFAEPSTELEEHVARCRWCREDREDADAAALQATAEELSSRKREVPIQPTPTPGEIWTMRSDLAGWGEPYRYFNPPHVLVLRAFSGAVYVAQICDDIAFATPRDVLLPAEVNAFAEPWNRFIVQSADLHRQVATVPLDTVTAVRRASGASADYAGSELLHSFMDLELQTASWFCSAPVQTAVNVVANHLRLLPSELTDHVLSHGRVANLAAAADSPNIELTADLRPFSRGFVSVTIDPTGHGQVHSRFEQPDHISMGLVAPSAPALLPLQIRDVWQPVLTLNSGLTRLPLAVALPASAHMSELILLAWSNSSC